MLEPDGERFIPEFMGGQLIEAEHVIRYALAAELCKGRRVLDAGCGVGWGTEILWGAGAESASGVDLSADAVANARAHVPGADFKVGNLADLPFGEAAFDLVVCFEAIEHVEQQEKVFDELVRVLAPGGILMVSSPNPRVYPAGNPFHIHELVPEELVEAARSRLQNVSLFLQHEQMASMLVQGDSLGVGRSDEVLLRVVRPLGSGSDPYSMIVASDGEAPELPTIVGSAPSALQELLDERTQALAEKAERLRSFLEEARYPRRDAPVPAEWEREQAALRRDPRAGVRTPPRVRATAGGRGASGESTGRPGHRRRGGRTADRHCTTRERAGRHAGFDELALDQAGEEVGPLAFPKVVTTLHFVSAPGGSTFMHELLGVIAGEVRDLGPEAGVDEVTVSQGPFPPGDEAVYVVEPHEFFLKTPAADQPTRDQLARTIAICVEHPGTASFQQTVDTAGQVAAWMESTTTRPSRSTSSVCRRNGSISATARNGTSGVGPTPNDRMTSSSWARSTPGDRGTSRSTLARSMRHRCCSLCRRMSPWIGLVPTSSPEGRSCSCSPIPRSSSICTESSVGRSSGCVPWKRCVTGVSW